LLQIIVHSNHKLKEKNTGEEFFLAS